MSHQKKTTKVVDSSSSDEEEKSKVASKKKKAPLKTKKPTKKRSDSEEESPQRKPLKKIITKKTPGKKKFQFLLPIDLIFMLVVKLEILDLVSLVRVNKYYHKIIMTEDRWKSFAKMRAGISFELFSKTKKETPNPMIRYYLLCFREVGIVHKGIEKFVPKDKYQRRIAEFGSKEEIKKLLVDPNPNNIIFGLAKGGRTDLMRELSLYPFSCDDSKIEPAIDGYIAENQLEHLNNLLGVFTEYEKFGETPFYTCINLKRENIFVILYNLYINRGNPYLRDHREILYKHAFLKSLFGICDTISGEFICSTDVLVGKEITKAQFDYALPRISEKYKLLLTFILNDHSHPEFMDETLIRLGNVPGR